MSHEKHGYERAPSPPPIPTYEEATSSRTADEASEDTERHGLLGPHSHSSVTRRNGYYQAPSVQSVDEDEDDDRDIHDDHDDHGDAATLLEQMEMLDPERVDDGPARRSHRSMGSRFSKRLHSFTHTLASLGAHFHLPRVPWPAWRPALGALSAHVPSLPAEYRPSWSIVARLCGLVVIASLVYVLVVSDVVPMGNGLGTSFSPDRLRELACQTVQPTLIEKHLEYITSYDHVGGTRGSYVLGQWIEGKFKDAHMDTYTHDEYYVYMTFPTPRGRRVAIVHPPDMLWEAKLEEPPVSTPPRTQTAAFHALSVAGNVTGPLLYLNYCHPNDFTTLADRGINTHGAVALCRYYGTQPDLAMKVKTAQDAGILGVLVYSDPADDGFKKGNPWPDGKWRSGESIQRGSAARTNMILGDVLTPGNPSIKKQGRMSPSHSPGLPKIPSLPLSWKDAQQLLKSLKGLGQTVPDDWKGGVPDVGDKWFSGHPELSPRVNLRNDQDEVQQQRITNVFGSLKGSEDSLGKIIVGNHRDSWCFGAAGPGSGTAVMLEVARVLGEIRAQGWRPLRTIEFASWDAGEYNRIGSTEHVEANVKELRSNALAYLNVDVGVTGESLWANGSPMFQHVWRRTLDEFFDPHTNKTFRELWETKNTKMGNLNAGSDHIAFQAIAGTSSIDFGFAGDEKGYASNPMAHSCFETLDWMKKYIDPDFKYHARLAQIWVSLILQLAQEPIVPLKINEYAHSLQEEGRKLLEWTESISKGYDVAIFQPLVDSLSMFKKQADEFHMWESIWYNQVYATGGFESQTVTMQRVAHNNKIAKLESDLLDLPMSKDDMSEHGLPGREQFKHVIFAPDINNSLATSVFPFVKDAIEKKDWDLAAKMIQKTADILTRAGDSLNSV